MRMTFEAVLLASLSAESCGEETASGEALSGWLASGER